MQFKQLAERARRKASVDNPLTVEAVVETLLLTRDGDVSLYVSGGDYFVYGVFVPTSLLEGDFVDDVIGWNMSVPSGYGYGYGFKERDIEPFLTEPLDGTGSSILDRGIAPLFMRRFESRGSYVEPNQRLAHALDLHLVDGKGGWCRLNHLGETVPVLRIDGSDGFVCTIEREALNLFLVAANMSLVRVVDVTTTSVGHDGPRSVPGPEFTDRQEDVFLRTLTLDGKLFCVRGFDIVRVSPEQSARARLVMQGKQRRQYANFIVHDFKHGAVVEWDADPQKIGNYFVPSELPFGTSPVFFKPDVLTQYRTDPSRFRVLPDRVESIGAWSLPYYVNDEGQVHVYLVDLATIPFEEQLGWKRWNQEPLGPIAKRAFRQDFQGEWTSEYDPLLSLRDVLESFPATDAQAVTVWALGKLPPTRNLDFLGYVVTESQKEFDDQILALAQIVVEGLNRGEINRLADALGCREDKQLGSIKQLAKVMENLGVPKDVRDTILGPLIEIQERRSSSVAHRGTGSVQGDPRSYFRDLLRRCDEAMRKLAELVTASTFVTPPPSP